MQEHVFDKTYKVSPSTVLKTKRGSTSASPGGLYKNLDYLNTVTVPVYWNRFPS